MQTHTPWTPSHASSALTPQPCHHTRAPSLSLRHFLSSQPRPPSHQGTRCPAHPATLQAQKTLRHPQAVGPAPTHHTRPPSN